MPSLARRTAALAGAVAITSLAAGAPAPAATAAGRADPSMQQLCPQGDLNPIIGCMPLGRGGVA
jgi:hypothetical protein